MWRIYSYDRKAIQLISTEDKIRNMLENAVCPGLPDRFDILMKPVVYDLDQEMRYIVPDSLEYLDYLEPYFHKRPAFEHEKEVRAIIYETKEKYSQHMDVSRKSIIDNLRERESRLSLEEKILNAASHLNERKSVISMFTHAYPDQQQLSINSLEDYLVGVRVHPMAQEWYVEVIQILCEQYGINFLGKSDLYKGVSE